MLYKPLFCNLQDGLNDFSFCCPLTLPLRHPLYPARTHDCAAPVRSTDFVLHMLQRNTEVVSVPCARTKKLTKGYNHTYFLSFSPYNRISLCSNQRVTDNICVQINMNFLHMSEFFLHEHSFRSFQTPLWSRLQKESWRAH